jgi:type II secretory pathway pseudopilin PulG
VRARRPRGDQGETLVEVTVSVILLGITVVALIGGLVTAVMMSDVHRKQARAQAYVRNFAEAIQQGVLSSGGYKPCGQPADYLSAAPTAAGLVPSVDPVEYWNGTSFVTTCGTDGGVQRLTLRVTVTGDSRVAESLQIVIRKPCRPTVDAVCA